MKDQHSISFLLLNHLHTSTLLVIDNFISQLPCNLEDLQYALEIKMNVRGVLVRRMSYSTYSLRRCRRQKRTAFSSPLLSTALAAPAAGGAITSVYLPRWWTPPVRCAPAAPVDSSSLAAPANVCPRNEHIFCLNICSLSHTCVDIKN